MPLLSVLLLSFAIYTAAIILWVFAVKNAQTAWFGLLVMFGDCGWFRLAINGSGYDESRLRM